jgi:hypothetical protein
MNKCLDNSGPDMVSSMDSRSGRAAGHNRYRIGRLARHDEEMKR